MIQRQRYQISLSFPGKKSFFLIQIGLRQQLFACSLALKHNKVPPLAGGRWAVTAAGFYGPAVKERWERRGRRTSSLMMGTTYG